MTQVIFKENDRAGKNSLRLNICLDDLLDFHMQSLRMRRRRLQLWQFAVPGNIGPGHSGYL